MTEIYGQIIIESFAAALAFSLKGELALKAALAFGEMPAEKLLACAFAGAVAGHLVNYAAGRMLILFIEKESVLTPALTLRFQKVRTFVERYCSWLVLFCFIGVAGSFITLFAGIFRVRFLIFIALLIAGRVAGYFVL